MLLWRLGVEIIKKDASKTSRFPTMRIVEVAVGPFLKALIPFRIVTITNSLEGSMKMLHVILVNIIWRNVCTTAKPPDASGRLKITIVEMQRWAVRILWVHNRGYTAREEGHLLTRRQLHP